MEKFAENIGNNVLIRGSRDYIGGVRYTRIDAGCWSHVSSAFKLLFETKYRNESTHYNNVYLHSRVHLSSQRPMYPLLIDFKL